MKNEKLRNFGKRKNSELMFHLIFKMFTKLYT